MEEEKKPSWVDSVIELQNHILRVQKTSNDNLDVSKRIINTVERLANLYSEFEKRIFDLQNRVAELENKTKGAR